MTDTAVHDFTSKSVLVDTDEFYLVQSPYGAGDDRKTQWANIKSSLASQGLAGLPLSGALTFTPDNSFDIGASGAIRPRTGYFGTNVIAGAAVQAGTNVQVSAAGLVLWVGRSQISSPADGNLLLWDSAQATFGRLQFGGTSASFPALKRSSATLQARLADDTAFADFQLGALQLNGHALFGTDNTFDIGASGANRPRNIFMGNNLTVGGDINQAGGSLVNGGFVLSHDFYNRNDAGIYRFGASDDLQLSRSAAGVLGINQTPTAVISAAVTITNAADGAANIGHRIKINFNGIDYWIPASSVAF